MNEEAQVSSFGCATKQIKKIVSEISPGSL
jgi:hypothetical protein